MPDAPILEETRLVEDFAAADDFAKKHTPYIESCGADETQTVCVTVGHEVPHPNEPGHYITWIELFGNGVPIARFDLSPVVTAPTVSIRLGLKSGTVLRAVEHCNLHGTWAYEVTL